MTNSPAPSRAAASSQFGGDGGEESVQQEDTEGDGEADLIGPDGGGAAGEADRVEQPQDGHEGDLRWGDLEGYDQELVSAAQPVPSARRKLSRTVPASRQQPHPGPDAGRAVRATAECALGAGDQGGGDRGCSDHRGGDLQFSGKPDLQEPAAPRAYAKKKHWQGVARRHIPHAIERGVRVAMGTDKDASRPRGIPRIPGQTGAMPPTIGS
ncbi:hypothetical protein [Actinacidiphila oryziradicis]|uniref:hypothetical protein n=1 Tax=Actinacidiphila oryziradicis TaxID=2571141 RepID=UPI0023F36AE3|nr:hypothetical protein [Actinacidiphila oryziradicis]